MAEEKEKNLQHAQATFQTLCSTLDRENWRYEKWDGLRIKLGVQGEDLPMEIVIEVETDRQLVILLSHLPCVIPEDERLDLGVAITTVNDRLVDGCFDFDLGTGDIYFRMTNSFKDSELGSDLFMYMLLCACHTIDDYNDKFLLLSKGLLTLDKFLESDK